MKRALLPVLFVASLSLTACGQATAPASTSAQTQTPGTTPVAQGTTPAPAQGATDSTQTQNATAPATTTISATAPSTAPAGESAQNPTQHEDPKPMIKWYPKGIGYPLVSDDPAAQGKKVVMLTFDDGPSGSGSTAKVLDVLKAENVHAMFFVTGYGAKNIDLVKREYAEGHTLGVHTQTHPDLTTLTDQQVHDEITPVYNLITQITGHKPHWLRPPFGSYNQKVIDIAKNDYGMDLMNWSDGSLDWDSLDKNGWKDPKLVVAEVMKQLHPGAVILMHDIHEHTAEALPEVIHEIRAKGYDFVVVPDEPKQ